MEESYISLGMERFTRGGHGVSAAKQAVWASKLHSGLLKRSRFPLGDKAFLFLHSAGFGGLEKGNTLCGGTLYFA
jgi:hypothetical protein